MILEHVATWSAGLIALWATRCCLSGKVRDGVLGKLIYAAIALNGYWREVTVSYWRHKCVQTTGADLLK